LDAAQLQRHHLVLDLNAGTGLLTWEALRRAPEGGVWALAYRSDEATALREMAARLPELERPVVLQGTLAELPELLALRGEGDVRFDAVVGRSALTPPRDAAAVTVASPAHRSGPGVAASLIAPLLRCGGILSLAQPIPRYTQRLYALVTLDPLGQALARRLQDAEEAIYTDPADPMVNWAEEELREALTAAGLTQVSIETVEARDEVRITPALVERWFTPAPAGERPSYSQRLASFLDADELAAVEALYRQALTGQTVPWRSVTAYIVARRAA
jgi:putative ATPase